VVIALGRSGAIHGVGSETEAALGHAATSLVGHSFSRLVAPDQRKHLVRILERCRTDQPVWDELVLLAADGKRVPMLCCFQRLSNPRLGRGGLLVTCLKLERLRPARSLDAAVALGQLAFRCHGPAHRLMQAVEAVRAQHPKSQAAARCRAELDGLLDAMSKSVVFDPEAQTRRAIAPSDPDSGKLSQNRGCHPQTKFGGAISTSHSTPKQHRLGVAPDSGRRPAALPPVDVVRLLEEAVRLIDLDPACQDLEVMVRPEFAAIWAMVHPVGLVFVTLHLARNARDATTGAKHPRLLIDAYQSGQEVILEFRDNGPGLEAEDLSCAFAPFFKKSAGGDDHTGLGLATCSELVRHMGGTIRMESRPPRGATVFVTLPAATAPK
jgi:PAS domain S-box-containing protein